MSKELLNGKRILAVDDEPDILASLVALLDMCEVVTASDFKTAEHLLKTRAFDIAVLDIMGVDGYKLLDLAWEKNVIPVMLTAQALNPENIVKSFKSGAASFVPKDKLEIIEGFLVDILEARGKGRYLRSKWLERMGSYCESNFGSDWQDKDKEFWTNFKYFY